MTPLRILQLYPKSDYFTGAAIQLRDLAIGLARRGHAVTVATSPNPHWAGRLVAAGVPADKIAVIYSGTDVERFHPGIDGGAIRRELGITPQQFVVTQIGVRSWRGWRDVLDAMARVAPRLADARLLFVGAPPPRIAELSDHARERGLGGRVLVIGHREDVPQILAASDVVVEASYAGAGLTG